MTLRCENTRTTPLSRVHPAREGSAGWEPGDLCKLARDNRTIGMVIYYHDAENVLVLWTRTPHVNWSDEAVQVIAQDILDEEDNDIMRILMR